MAHVLGIAEYQTKEGGIGWVPRRQHRIPKAPIHAAAPGGTTALCGVALVDTADNREWPPGMGACRDYGRLAQGI